MSILKRQVNSSSDFSSFFSVITYNVSVSFSLMHFLLWTKGSHENINFDVLKCSDENLPNCSCYFWNHKWVFLQILNDSSVSLNILLCNFFSWNVVYFSQSDQSKCKFFRLFSARIKIHQVLVIFETKHKFLFKFCTTLWYHETYPLHAFLAETLYTFSTPSTKPTLKRWGGLSH